MHRFYCSSQNIPSDKISIFDKEQLHHIRDVLRLKPKDKIIMFDDKGNAYNCIIEKIAKEVNLKIIGKRLSLQDKKGMRVTVACAVPKKSKIDDIIDKLTQLGVDRIIPLNTERVVVKLDKHKEKLRWERWKKIAQSAAQQSQRNTLPVIDPIMQIKEVLSESENFDLKLLLTLLGRRRSLKDIFAKLYPKNVLVLIGPEGDFSDGEVELAKRVGCISVSLGDLVLRVETAAIAVASFIRLYADR